MVLDLTLDTLSLAYRSGKLTPRSLISRLLEAANARGPDPAWITRLTQEQLEPYLARLEQLNPDTLPLYGIPFAIKDNIDLAGVPTTAACPEFAYTPKRSAFVVQRLIEAGAIPMGKTNLDQFATGLVGERSPEAYGVPNNTFDPERIPGGSSSGSAVVTAQGQVAFALGTDTAGSGRVPACFNNLFGVKPTLGLLSTRGVVPACATLDTISIFSLTADDAQAVLGLVSVFDPECAWSRQHNFKIHGKTYGSPPASFRFGVPPESQWQTCKDYTLGMHQAVTALESLGGEKVELNASPLLAAARLLYEGPWIAERYHAVRELIEAHPEAMHPVTRQVILSGAHPLAVDAFDARYQLAEYKRQADAMLAEVDLFLIPTTTDHPSKAAVAIDPVGSNSRLGTWTNFVNLLDYSALAVPIGVSQQNLPYGVTLLGSAFDDLKLLNVGRALEASLKLPLGATGLARKMPAPLPPAQVGTMDIVVCGAHMDGLPLNNELRSLGGQFSFRTYTAARYRFYALAGGPPVRPALVRNESDGRPIEVEVWRLPIESVGSFLAGISAPLGLGQVELSNSEWKTGFICAAGALHASGCAEDITTFCSWRAWLSEGNVT